MNITIPHNWTPRDYQLPVFTAFDEGCKRFVLLYHRRAGKDDVCLHLGAKSAFTKVGNYWHMLPEYAQGRKAIWEAVNPHTGKKRIDEAFPLELRKRTNNQEMFIEFLNGSTWQIVGSDRFDSAVGSAPIGIVFSEYALANPYAWDYLSPILEENGGHAFFISTVRGKNHFWQLCEFAKDDPDWYYQKVDADKSGVFSQEQLDNICKQYQARRGEDEGLALFRQEYFNDPSAGIPGAYYNKLLMQAEKEGRICNVPHNPSILVTTGWDLGIGDSTAIWFAQQIGREIRIIDYYENSGQGLEHYVKVLASKPYNYYEHLLPHDADVSELGTGKRRIDVLRSLGLTKTRVLPRTSIDDRIQATRTTLPQCYFDEQKNKKGLNALSQYQRAYDEKLQTFKDRPLHDWTSHAADAFGYLCQGIRPVVDRAARSKRAETDYDIFG